MKLGEFKKVVVSRLDRGLAPIRANYARVMGRRDGRYLDFIAENGAKMARERAEATMELVGPATGISWKKADGTYRLPKI